MAPPTMGVERTIQELCGLPRSASAASLHQQDAVAPSVVVDSMAATTLWRVDSAHHRASSAAANEPSGQRCTKQTTLTQFCVQHREADVGAHVQVQHLSAQIIPIIDLASSRGDDEEDEMKTWT